MTLCIGMKGKITMKVQKHVTAESIRDAYGCTPEMWMEFKSHFEHRLTSLSESVAIIDILDVLGLDYTVWILEQASNNSYLIRDFKAAVIDDLVARTLPLKDGADDPYKALVARTFRKMSDAMRAGESISDARNLIGRLACETGRHSPLYMAGMHWAWPITPFSNADANEAFRDRMHEYLRDKLAL